MLNCRPPASDPPTLDLGSYGENSAQPTLGTRGLGRHTPKRKAPASDLPTRIADWRTYPTQQSGVGSDDSETSENESLQNSVSNARSSGQTFRKLWRVRLSKNLRLTPRVEGGSLTINPMKNPNTRQNSSAERNPNQNPNTRWKIRIGGNPNATENTNIRRNPNARGNRNLGRDPNLVIAEQVSAKEKMEVDIGNRRGRSHIWEKIMKRIKSRARFQEDQS